MASSSVLSGKREGEGGRERGGRQAGERAGQQAGIFKVWFGRDREERQIQRQR